MSPLKLARPVIAIAVLVVIVVAAASMTFHAKSALPKTVPIPANAVVPNVLGMETTAAADALTRVGLKVKRASHQFGTIDPTAIVFVTDMSAKPGAVATMSAVVTITVVPVDAHSLPLADVKQWRLRGHGLVVLASGIWSCVPCHTYGGAKQAPTCKSCHANSIYASLLPTSAPPPAPASSRPAKKAKRRK